MKKQLNMSQLVIPLPIITSALESLVSLLKGTTVTHQVSVDEAVCFQVLHALTDILTHGQKPRLLQGPASLPQEVHEAAVVHELGHDQQGALLQANAVQLHQFGVAQPPGKHNKKHTQFHFLVLKAQVAKPAALSDPQLLSSSCPPSSLVLTS